jgi:hypothetical protein
MHEVEVNKVGSEIFERSVKGGFDIIGVVGVVPELRGDEKLTAGNTRILDGVSYGLLGPVNASGVYVFVARLERNRDRRFLRVCLNVSTRSAGCTKTYRAYAQVRHHVCGI